MNIEVIEVISSKGPNQQVTILFTDDNFKDAVPFIVINIDDLKNKVRNHLALSEIVKISTIPLGPLDILLPDQPKPPDPTQDELDRLQFFKDFRIFRNNEMIKTLPQELANRYKIEYGFIG